jgi:hypothetical protein
MAELSDATVNELEGFNSLNALLSDFVLNNHSAEFYKWLIANDPNPVPFSLETAKAILEAHLLQCHRMVAVSRSRIFRRL